MTEPINLQVNILQGQDVARQSQVKQDVASHQQIGQEMNRAKDQAESETVQTSPDAQQAMLSKDGSGRGRAFQRGKGKPHAESAPEIERTNEPEKGRRVDFTR